MTSQDLIAFSKFKPTSEGGSSDRSDDSDLEDEEVMDLHEHHYTQDDTMQQPTSRSNTLFNYEIFSSIIPEQKYLSTVFGGDKALYDDFTKNAFLWDEFFELCKYKLFTLADFIHNEFFYKMIEINKRLTKSETDDGILPVLKELTGRKRHFLLPFVYIANYVPKQYEKMSLVTFGVSDNYPEKIAKVKAEIESSKRAMRSVKDILRDYHILYESAI